MKYRRKRGRKPRRTTADKVLISVRVMPKSKARLKKLAKWRQMGQGEALDWVLKRMYRAYAAERKIRFRDEDFPENVQNPKVMYTSAQLEAMQRLAAAEAEWGVDHSACRQIRAELARLGAQAGG